MALQNDKVTWIHTLYSGPSRNSRSSVCIRLTMSLCMQAENNRNRARMAKDWKTVPEQISCDTPNALNEPILIGAREEKPVKLEASSCKNIKFLEHLHLHIDLKTQASW